MKFTEEQIEYMASLDLDENERKALFKVMFRKYSDIDESAKYVGWYIQMRAFGTLNFRIIHSPKSWTKAKKIFRQAGINLDDLEKEPLMANRVIAYRVFKKDYPSIRDLWDILTKIKRRDGTMHQNKKLSDIDPVP